MNSSLVEYTRLSPNHSGPRTAAIDRITPHCVVGQLSGPSLGAWFEKPSTQASCNYAIDTDGRTCLIVDEDNRAWTSSSNANDQRAVTIECASDLNSPYAFKDIVYNSLISLCVDICERHEKDTLLWIPDRAKALSYKPKANEMLLTVHRWFASTDCPGEWMMAHMADLASRVTASLQKPGATVAPAVPADSRQAFISAIAPSCVEDMQKTGIPASVTIAQACLESAFGTSELAREARNLFGMKATLSGVTWPGRTYEKQTQEYSANATYTVKAQFRAYDTIQASIADHSNYLLTAKNGSGLRYAGIATASSPEEACDILIAGGYATDPAYKQKLLDLISKYGLSQYDTAPASGATVAPDEFRVHVDIDNLNIRSGPGTKYDSKGFLNAGEYTITKVKKKKNGQAWGKIKPISGWICLDYAEQEA